jgi:hypothetical protein
LSLCFLNYLYGTLFILPQAPSPAYHLKVLYTGAKWLHLTQGYHCKQGLGCCDYCVTICDPVPGEYTITETLKPGWTNTDPVDGTGQKTVGVTCDNTVAVLFGNKEMDSYHKSFTGCTESVSQQDFAEIMARIEEILSDTNSTAEDVKSAMDIYDGHN